MLPLLFFFFLWKRRWRINKTHWIVLLEAKTNLGNSQMGLPHPWCPTSNAQQVPSSKEAASCMHATPKDIAARDDCPSSKNVIRMPLIERSFLLPQISFSVPNVVWIRAHKTFITQGDGRCYQASFDGQTSSWWLYYALFGNHNLSIRPPLDPLQQQRSSLDRCKRSVSVPCNMQFRFFDSLVKFPIANV